MREFTFYVSRVTFHAALMTKIIITGSKGRMGRALVSCAAHHPDLQIVGQIDQGDDLRAVIGQGDVVIDFSSHSATPAIATLCAAHKKAMVVGTTGHSDEGKSQIANCQSARKAGRRPAPLLTLPILPSGQISTLPESSTRLSESKVRIRALVIIMTPRCECPSRPVRRGRRARLK